MLSRSSTLQSCYLGTLYMIFYMIILAASIGGQKLISIFGVIVSAGSLIFPVSYMVVACVTEVYGLKQAKRMIFTATLCDLLVSGYLFFVIHIPSGTFWHNQAVFSRVTTVTASILLTSTFAFFASEYINAKLLEHLKILLKGKKLLFRAVASTGVAAVADATFMLPVIYCYSREIEARVFFSLIAFKITYEIILLPVFWLLVQFLREKEKFLNSNAELAFSSVTYKFK